MSEDKQAQAEASIRKKPRRIIQNQTLIQLLIILSITIPLPLSAVIIVMVFSIAPVIVIPSILIAWVVGSVTYIVLKVHVLRQNKKS